ncbi:uncharacterized protein BXZ73DRAFT_80557 [Epithele typhae]|uniref:uncharacterized protein n=1 Tax=Epithele typhae TaxID=378194 RepID=UPI002007AFFD|nr:uncharacterized protein BXZ73DRAFT_80557 [Epithele typhae]KAH9918551.1 hypothetical protein BXZ73DRAFT_80557 [Epithele typhae]
MRDPSGGSLRLHLTFELGNGVTDLDACPSHLYSKLMLDIGSLPVDRLSELGFFFGGVGLDEHASRLTLFDIHDATIAWDLRPVMLLAQLNATSDPTERTEIQAALGMGKRSMPLPDLRRTLNLVRGYGFGRVRYLSSLLGTMSWNRQGETYDELGCVSIGFIAHALRPQANRLVRRGDSGWRIARSRRQPRALDLFEADVPVLIEDQEAEYTTTMLMELSRRDACERTAESFVHSRGLHRAHSITTTRGAAPSPSRNGTP